MAPRSLLLVVVLLGARAASADCTRDDECPADQVCDMDSCSGGTPREADHVCSGTCTVDVTLRVVARGGVFAPATADTAACVGLELLPPLPEHRVALEVDYLTSRMARVGALIGVQPIAPLRLAARVDWLANAPSTSGVVSVRADLFGARLPPRALFRHVSLYAEAGAILSSAPADGIVGVGGAIWPPSLYRQRRPARPGAAR